MRILLILSYLLYLGCSHKQEYNFHVLEISYDIDLDLLIYNHFFQVEEDVVAFKRNSRDTLTVIQLESVKGHYDPYIISWTFPASSNLQEAKEELEKLGIKRLQQLIGCENIEESCTFIGQSEDKNTFLIDWRKNLETDVFPDDFDKEYKLRIEYSFDPTYDKIYGLN